MDAHDGHQKAFLSTLFQSGQHPGSATALPIFPYNEPSQAPQQAMTVPHSQSIHPPPLSPPPLSPPPLTIEMLGAMMQMQGLDSTASPPTPSAFNPQSLLEQQFKLNQLQQLQQLQNQIFQQQIALISGQTTGMLQQSVAPIEPRREPGQNQFNGLPTPGPSAEIHAQQPTMDYISPMILNSNTFQPGSEYPMDSQMPTISNYGVPTRGSTSAPEHVAFPHTANIPSSDVDFDISPLASPWLGAAHHHHHHHHQQQQQHISSSLTKRNAESSGDEGANQPARKKQHSPAIHPTNNNNSTSGSRKSFRGSRSTNSTPLLHSTRSRQGSIAEESYGDTPSPVDLSMPPPAPPLPEPSSSASASASSIDSRPSPVFNAHITPVTPASIMNLGRLGVVNPNAVSNHAHRPIVPVKGGDASAKGASHKPRVTLEPVATRSKRKTTNTSSHIVSPNLKAILPAHTAPGYSGTTTSTTTAPRSPPTPTPTITTTTRPSTTSTNNHNGVVAVAAAAAAAVPPAVRKTSHKAAEQKRRDSLKTTFDELRLLLPPLPLPTDAASDDQPHAMIPILPGALPPRGPPKTGGEGPNKGVSKLQLLMCGNEYIKVLKGRVERRDEEIGRLRREVRRLRGGVCGGGGSGSGVGGMGVVGEEGEGEEEEVDLERDLDAVEGLGGLLGRMGSAVVTAGGTGGVGSVGQMSGAASVVGEDEGDDDMGE